MSHLSLTLFGSLTITLDGRPVTRLESDKVRGLLARLVLEPERAFRRETLSALFWPEVAPERAAPNLRQALYALRQAIGDAYLLVDAADRPVQRRCRCAGGCADLARAAARDADPPPPSP